MMIFMGGALSRRLVPDGLWELAEPLLPRFTVRRQGGGRAPVDERLVFTAVVYVLTSGCAWRQLPPGFEVSPATAHRRFTAWTAADVWRRLRHTARARLPCRAEVDWSAAIADAAAARSAPRRDISRRPSRPDRPEIGDTI
jgi:transposase